MIPSYDVRPKAPTGVELVSHVGKSEITQEIDVGSLTWFYRERVSSQLDQPYPVILLHDLPSQSHSWGPVLAALAEQGFRAIAPDWIGYGFSAKPEKYEFDYRAQTFVAALDNFLNALEIDRFHLVVQGYLGLYGLLYALQQPERIERLVILNVPLISPAQLPWRIQQLGLPFVGDMLTQDPLLVDRTLEGGGIYQVPDKDLDVYRRPYLKTSEAGRALLATVRQLKLKALVQELESQYATWPWPTALIWGLADPWVPLSVAETFVKQVKRSELIKLDQVGHYPQQDWHQKVSEALIPYLRKLVV